MIVNSWGFLSCTLHILTYLNTKQSYKLLLLCSAYLYIIDCLKECLQKYRMIYLQILCKHIKKSHTGLLPFMLTLHFYFREEAPKSKVSLSLKKARKYQKHITNNKSKWYLYKNKKFLVSSFFGPRYAKTRVSKYWFFWLVEWLYDHKSSTNQFLGFSFILLLFFFSKI